MKIHMAVVMVSLILGLAGCGKNSDTSTGGSSSEVARGENTITTESGGVIYVVHDERVFVDNVVRLKYGVKNSAGEPQSGTLHWDDNSSSRVRGNGLLKHIYRSPGVYKVAIQPDGEDKLVVGTVFVLSQPDCRPLVVPAFNTSTGFPTSIPNPFEIKKDGNCYNFVTTDAGASFSVRGNSTINFLELFTRTNIFIYSCYETVIGSVNECRVPNILGGIDGNSGAATFPSSDGTTCSGFVRFSGDISSLVVSSDEIIINCE